VPDSSTGPANAGPYRFLSNPMYTIGYLQTYGVALIVGSWPGLVAAVFAHVSILLFHFLIEKPHFERLQRTT
jgi:protein-S-isoprenylcysteine O-methyltransferase Ste14